MGKCSKAPLQAQHESSLSVSRLFIQVLSALHAWSLFPFSLLNGWKQCLIGCKISESAFQSREAPRSYMQVPHSKGFVKRDVLEKVFLSLAGRNYEKAASITFNSARFEKFQCRSSCSHYCLLFRESGQGGKTLDFSVSVASNWTRTSPSTYKLSLQLMCLAPAIMQKCI